MAIWEFTNEELEDLDKILEHCEALIELGIEQDDDMMTELRSEIYKRNNDEED